MALLELLQKHIQQQDLIELINQVGEAEHPEALLTQLASQVPQHRDTLMTIAEQA